jgi:hypothetical protein
MEVFMVSETYFVITCKNCGHEAHKPMGSWHDAEVSVERGGWKFVRGAKSLTGDWYCTNCLREADSAEDYAIRCGWMKPPRPSFWKRIGAVFFD